ncbi:hypothetical protein [Victivallis sp. Marseille-Q1083]|uniref:hypothetical protein n=1 Tax=Victivallis sp. Marseille-Q1083 TaxID=2717288 RepID=UPI0015888B93|nr:hypothetical protein [Victivallis sp. Marseille-Q1083]
MINDNKKSKNSRKKINAALSSELMDDFDRFETLVMAHWKIILAGAIVLLVAVTVAGAWWFHREQVNQKAMNVLADARTVEQLTAALQEYGTHPNAVNARLRLARLYQEDKKYDLALEEISAALVLLPENELRHRLSLNQGYLLELGGKLPEAAEAFALAGGNTGMQEALRCEGNYNAARLYIELKDLAKAENMLQSIVPPPDTTPQMTDPALMFWQGQAQFLYNLLENGHYGTLAAAATD